MSRVIFKVVFLDLSFVQVSDLDRRASELFDVKYISTQI